MNVLWQHLQKMAKAQLFNGGYLAGPAIRFAAEPQKEATGTHDRTARRNRGRPRLQPAPCR